VKYFEEMRQRPLERLIRRVDTRLVRLKGLHARISWYRLAVFVGSFLAAVVSTFFFSGAAALATMGLGLVVFGVFVRVHHVVEAAYRRHRLWRQIKSSQLARLTLDWDGIPARQSDAGATGAHPFAADLDLFGDRSLFQLLDTAGSHDGSQRLRTWLLDVDPSIDVILNRQELVKELVPLSRFRDKLRLAFDFGTEARLEGEKLRTWVKMAQSPGRFRGIFLQACLLLATNHLLVLAYAVDLVEHPLWEITLAAWFLFFLARFREVSPLIDSVVALDDQLSALARVLRFLEAYPHREGSRVERLCSVFRDPETRPSRHVRRAKIVSSLAGLRMNPLVALLLNLLVPWDFLLGWLIARLRQRLEGLVPLWLDRSAELEATESLANLGYLNPDYAFPTVETAEITSNRRFAFEAAGLAHPLIPSSTRVSNDFVLGDTRIVVLTGSNMSGKSTFLKTLGINMVLAHAGAPVCAASLRLGLFRLFSCIRVTDSVQDHVSTFYAEVRRLKQLLDALGARDARPLFYLVDEIFRGTNNRERVAGGRAFMSALVGQNGAGAISTHDLELAFAGERLAQVANYHFREELTGRRMVFDYKLRKGICPTTNALKIMELEGLPVAHGDS